MHSKLFRNLFSIDSIIGSLMFWAIIWAILYNSAARPFYELSRFRIEQEFNTIPFPPQTGLQYYASHSREIYAYAHGTFATELTSTEIRRYYHQTLLQLGWQYKRIDWNDYYCKGNLTAAVNYLTSPTRYYSLDLSVGGHSKCETSSVGFPIINLAIAEVLAALGCSTSWLFYILYTLHFLRKRRPGHLNNQAIPFANIELNLPHIVYFFIFLGVSILLISLYGIGHYFVSLLVSY